MPRFFSDTDPEAEAIQIELLRRKTPAQRISMMRSLTTIAVRNSRRAIAAANPHLSPAEQELQYIELCYGPEVGAIVRERRAHAKS